MDRRILRSASFNGCGKNPAPSSPAAGSRAAAAAAGAGSKDDAAVAERKALLPRLPSGGLSRQPSGGLARLPSGGLARLPPGGMARKGHKGPKRRVQWKDRHGKKLTEVLEFQPSDSSDSDDEYLDTCICSIM
ncbi:hypothetical protein ACP70R_002108 [Stipagrostis hirtigluma subsp. patula]